MLITFFEEFPTKENLSKLKYVRWPTKLYIAAKSIEEFNQVRSTVKNKHIKEFIYWPVLHKKEGYWISPFSKRGALLRVLSELKSTKNPVMLDLELPTTKNPFLYVTQAVNFFRNKCLIREFINNHPGKVCLAEYYPEGKRKEKILKMFGLHYQKRNVSVIKMLYHSLHHFDEEFIREELKQGKREFGSNYIVSFGTIAKGINGNEPLLTASQLRKDLQRAKEADIKEVVIFRLGGLNEKYLKAIEEFTP